MGCARNAAEQATKPASAARWMAPSSKGLVPRGDRASAVDFSVEPWDQVDELMSRLFFILVCFSFLFVHAAVATQRRKLPASDNTSCARAMALLFLRSECPSQ
jgi:hypothetical protein